MEAMSAPRAPSSFLRRTSFTIAVTVAMEGLLVGEDAIVETSSSSSSSGESSVPSTVPMPDVLIEAGDVNDAASLTIAAADSLVGELGLELGGDGAYSVAVAAPSVAQLTVRD